MSKLWIFGDSQSCAWDSIIHGTHKEYVDKYNPQIHFSDILLEKLNIDEVTNLAVEGSCNYTILESVGNCIDDMNPNDYVVIGWSEITRWRCTSLNKNNWTIVAPNFTFPDTENMEEVYRYESVERNSDIVIKELESWIRILNKSLPPTLNWSGVPLSFDLQSSAFMDEEKNKHRNKRYLKKPNFLIKRIDQETDIKDKHISEKGHKDVGTWMVNMLKEKSSI